jgi:2-polyprenyl-6-methoxyphenol hydroxylase-like FAD-dependent oxidoreductase
MKLSNFFVLTLEHNLKSTLNWPRIVLILNANGSELAKHPIHTQVSSWSQLFRVLMRHIHERGPKRDKVQCKYRFGCSVTSLADCGDKVDITYTSTDNSSTTIISANLVVCADGASSRLRTQFQPNINHQSCGFVVLRGTTPLEKLSQSAIAAFDADSFFIFNHNS